jgi:hypothetical protein
MPRYFQNIDEREPKPRFLKPHGLDANSLMDRQQNFRREVVSNLMHRMEDAKIDVEAIITGLDPDGRAHIFVINDPGQIDCADAIAFASIGAGKQHADSQFMMAQSFVLNLRCQEARRSRPDSWQNPYRFVLCGYEWLSVHLQ